MKSCLTQIHNLIPEDSVEFEINPNLEENGA